MTRKVAIVGSAENWHQAPLDDPSWEIWTLNDMFKVIPNEKIDLYFELHDMFAVQNSTPGELEWLKTATIPIYMMFVDESIPLAKQYPYEDIVKEYGRYFTNSVSWMIAFAIHEQVDEIGIWGVNMAHGTEYSAQKPSCEYFIGLARGKNIPVYVPESSSLLSSGSLYGLEKNAVGEDCMVRIENLGVHLTTAQQQKADATLREAKISGALEILQYFNQTYGV